MKRRLYFMWCISHKIALSNCTCVRKSSWNCSIKSSLNLASWASKLRAIPPLTRRIAHQNDNTGDVKPGKEGHLTVAFRFLSLHQSLCRPPPPATGNDYPGSSRCGYWKSLSAAALFRWRKNSKSSEIVNDYPPRPPFSALNWFAVVKNSVIKWCIAVSLDVFSTSRFMMKNM